MKDMGLPKGLLPDMVQEDLDKILKGSGKGKAVIVIKTGKPEAEMEDDEDEIPEDMLGDIAAKEDMDEKGCGEGMCPHCGQPMAGKAAKMEKGA